MPDGDVWVDRPRVGVFFFVIAGVFAAVTIGLLTSKLLRADWSGLLLTFSVVWSIAALLIFWRMLTWLRQTTYSISDEHLDVEWVRLRHTVLIRDIAEVRRVRFPFHPFHPFRPSMSYGTRLTNLLEIVDDRGYRTLISPTDPEEMRTEILRRRDALRGQSDGA